MTTIAAVEGDGWVVIGADSQSSDDDGFVAMMPDSKIFKNKSLIFAGAGSIRGINIIQHDFVPPAIAERDLDKYMTRTLIPSMRKTFQDNGYEFQKDGSPVENENIWLVVVKGCIYRINEDYSWERSIDGFYVAGSGEKIALGAMAALGSTIDTPQKAKKIVTKALQIASRYDASTGGKLTVYVYTTTQ